MPGGATATVTVDATADTSVEPDETVALTLTPGTGYTIGTTAEVVGTIANDDAPTTPAPSTPPSSDSSPLPRPTTLFAFAGKIGDGSRLFPLRVEPVGPRRLVLLRL